MHFLVFVPGGSGSDALGSLTRAGLADIAPNAIGIDVAPHDSPEGKQGAIFGWGEFNATHQMLYRPDLQDWIPNHAGLYSVGVWKDSPPTPADLLKDRWHPSHDVVLGDGKSWHVPVARRLPQKYGLQSGKPVLTVKQQFAAFWAASYDWYETLLGADVGSGRMEAPSNWWDYALMALSLNYRLTPEVVAHLELIDTENVLELVLVTVDGHAITKTELELQKKTDESPVVS